MYRQDISMKGGCGKYSNNIDKLAKKELGLRSFETILCGEPLSSEE